MIAEIQQNSNTTYRRLQLCSNRYFTTERVEMEDGAIFRGNCNGETLEIWGLTSGRARLDNLQLEAVQFVLLPAALGDYTLEAQKESKFLRTFVT